jgi:ketosteroid isomerase-like protein
MATTSSQPHLLGQPETTAAVCETLKRAIETRDAELAASVYADDVEFLIVNRNYPPSHPLVRRGRAAVLELYRDICSREMTHNVVATIVGDNAFAMREACLYADGCRVTGHSMAELRDGKIVRQTNLDAWDE